MGVDAAHRHNSKFLVILLGFVLFCWKWQAYAGFGRVLMSKHVVASYNHAGSCADKVSSSNDLQAANLYLSDILF